MYLFFKWLHLVAVISWMAGILYLYRLLIYQAERGANQDIHEFLTFAAGRLYKVITVPAMVFGFAAGLGMIALNPALLDSGWLRIKLIALAALAYSTIYAGRLIGRFAQREPNLPSGKRLRLLNEVPTLLMLVILGMAVFRPF